jgi:hypothetical protein
VAGLHSAVGRAVHVGDLHAGLALGAHVKVVLKHLTHQLAAGGVQALLQLGVRQRARVGTVQPVKHRGAAGVAELRARRAARRGQSR